MEGEAPGFVIVLGQSLGTSAFWIGFVLVMVFANSRFQLSDANPEKNDPLVVPRSFTTRFRYYLSASVYIAVFEFLYVLLVSIGSLPFLQGLLEEWIGSLDQGGNVSVGTPAWAALIITSVIPSAPGFRTVDRNLRATLHDFASIPKKARGLANEILEQLRQAGYSAEQSNIDDAKPENKRDDQLTWLNNAIQLLQHTTKNPSNATKYRQFFTTYKNILDDSAERRQQLEASITSTGPLITTERDALIHSAARFLSCALLHIESSEREARNKVRGTLQLKGLSILPFDFKLKQIILNILLVMFLGFAGSILALALVLPEGWRSIDREIISLIFYWLPFIALTMVTPFILAAGLLLYFMDKRLYENKHTIELEDRILAIFGLAIGCFCFGILPSLIGIMLADYELDSSWIIQIAPFGVTPACVGILFYALASWHSIKSEIVAGVIDAAIFSSIAGLFSYLAIRVSLSAGLEASQMTGIEVFTDQVMITVTPITYAIMVGITGAIQCNISRPMMKQASAGQ